jgi:Thoeris protein ThsB, TIR-like domain
MAMIEYYDLFSRTLCDQYDVFYDNSPDRAINSEDTDYIRWRLWDEHITNTSCTIVLIGSATWGRKFVDWEIYGTLEKNHGLIGVMLPGPYGLLSFAAGTNSLPPRLQDNVQTGYASIYSWNEITSSPDKSTRVRRFSSKVFDRQQSAAP